MNVSYIPLIALLSLMIGCGEDPSIYEGETLTVESPVTTKIMKSEKLDLREEESEKFRFTRLGAMLPWLPTPFYDYYLEPLPVPVPVSPDYALIDYVHPFYAYAELNWVDDDDGSYFERDDD